MTVEKMDEEECKQEQEDEHEALESMFMEDEFKIINPVGEKDPWFVFNFFFFVKRFLFDVKPIAFTQRRTSFGTVSR